MLNLSCSAAMQAAPVVALKNRLDVVHAAAREDESAADTAAALIKIADALANGATARAASAQIFAHDGGLAALCSLLRPSLAEEDEGLVAQRNAIRVLLLLAKAVREDDEAQVAKLQAARAGEALLGVVVRANGNFTEAAPEASCVHALALLTARGLPLSLNADEQRQLVPLLSTGAPAEARKHGAALLSLCMTPALAAAAAEAGLVQALVDAAQPPMVVLSPADESKNVEFSASASAVVVSLVRCGGAPLCAALQAVVPELVARLDKEITTVGYEGACRRMQQLPFRPRASRSSSAPERLGRPLRARPLRRRFPRCRRRGGAQGCSGSGRPRCERAVALGAAHSRACGQRVWRARAAGS